MGRGGGEVRARKAADLRQRAAAEPALPVSGEPVLTERRGRVLLVTLNRPEARNAFDQTVADAMHAAMDELDQAEDLFFGVITGAGDNFSAGADLKAAARGETIRTGRGGFGIFERPSRKPMIAAVEGYAVGGGLEVALCCDLIVAAKTAKLGLPEVRHNLVALGGGVLRLPKRIPYHLAMELALTGEFHDAEYFHRLGVVNRLVEEGKALESALAWCDQLAENGPLALAATKQIIFGAANWTEDEGWAEQARILKPVYESEDRAEGLRAFAEKRKPVWKGK